jgi:dihydropyrimidinase
MIFANEGSMDVALRNGTVVTASESFRADIGVDSGRIAQLGRVVPPAAREIDAAGKLVLPGCVDIHTHLLGSSQLHRIDDFRTGTEAAAAGGVTTVCDFAFQERGESLRTAIQRAREAAAPSLIDYALHFVLADPSPEAIAEIPSLVERGFAGMKIFMSNASFAENTVAYLRALGVAARAGALTAVHAEDHAIVRYRTEALVSAGRTGVEWFPHAHPPLAEEIAVRQAIAFAEVAGAPLYLVHLSSRGALEALQSARARGLPIYGETRPLYLYLTREVFDLPDGAGARYVGNPPLRDREDVEAVWSALQSETLSTVCSDHTPYPLGVKMNPSLTFATIPAGVSNLETLLPMLHSEGVLKGRISINRLVDLIATGPARLAGLHPRKGAISLGADADLVVFDPALTRTVDSSSLHSAADYDPFDGWTVTGWPVLTISRGEVIFAAGKIVGSHGRGQMLERNAFSSSSFR